MPLFLTVQRKVVGTMCAECCCLNFYILFWTIYLLSTCLKYFLLPNIWYLYSFLCQTICFLLKFLTCKLYRNVVLIFCPLVDPLGWQISSCILLWTEKIVSIILTFWVYWDSCYGLEYGQFCLMFHVLLKKVHSAIWWRIL